MQEVNITLSNPNIDNIPALKETVLVTIKTHDFKVATQFYCSPEMIRDALKKHIDGNFKDSRGIMAYFDNM